MSWNYFQVKAFKLSTFIIHHESFRNLKARFLPKFIAEHDLRDLTCKPATFALRKPVDFSVLKISHKDVACGGNWVNVDDAAVTHQLPRNYFILVKCHLIFDYTNEIFRRMFFQYQIECSNIFGAVIKSATRTQMSYVPKLCIFLTDSTCLECWSKKLKTFKPSDEINLIRDVSDRMKVKEEK